MDNRKTTENIGLFDGFRKNLTEGANRRREERGALLNDIIIFAIALFFARRHIAFGTYPLAGVFVATLPSRVWIALLGSVIGSLTLGKIGVIFAINSIATVFLRLLFSNGDKGVFKEPYIARVAAGAIGAFFSGIYNVISEGYSASSVFFGVFGVLFSVALSVAFYGVYAYGVSFEEVIWGEKNIFAVARDENEKWGRAAFCGGFLVFCYLIGYSLSEYDFFGISAAYIFVSALTLFTAKRFGGIKAMAVGFAAAFGISAFGAVSFALSGLGAGLLFGLGYGYGAIAGGVLLSLFSAYAGGMNEFLSVFPEYTVCAMLFYPFVNNAIREREGEESQKCSAEALDMVDSMTNLLRVEDSEIKGIEEALILAADSIKDYGKEDVRGEFEEYRDIVIALTSRFTPNPCDENIDILATKLYKRQKISPFDVERLVPFCHNSEEFLDDLYRLAGECERDSFERRRMEGISKEYELISKMLAESRQKRIDGKACDEKLSERLSLVFRKAGFPDGVIRALGERKKHIIGAGADKDGKLISSPRLKEALEEEAGVRLSEFEFYRKGETALFKGVNIPLWQVEYSTAQSSRGGGEISGDTALFFENDEVFYSLISDGMGSGRVAERTSRFVSSFLSGLLTSSENIPSALSAVNHLIRHRGEECSATVDLFSFDLLTSEAQFVKCGAAPSFVKRGDSLFKIKSETAPIGLMREVDSEKVRLEIKDGDYVIMISDGASILPEDSLWLIEFLSSAVPKSPEDFANEILFMAKSNSGIEDDITVSVVKLSKTA